MQRSFDYVIAMQCALQDFLEGIAAIGVECSELNALFQSATFFRPSNFVKVSEDICSATAPLLCTTRVDSTEGFAKGLCTYVHSITQSLGPNRDFRLR